MKRAQSGLCASNTSENQAGSAAAVQNSLPSAAGQRTVTPGSVDAHLQSNLEMILSSNLPNAFMCSLSQIQHMRSVCATKGEMLDENQLIFIFVRVTKLSKFLSKTFGPGCSSSLCSNSAQLFIYL